MDWDKLKIFHAVAQAGSFTEASGTLNLSQSAISRQIQSLEQTLKKPVLMKITRLPYCIRSNIQEQKMSWSIGD